MTDGAGKMQPQPKKRIGLSKDERRSLLRRIERRAGARGETPELALGRVEQALSGGQLEQARRLLDELEDSSPGLPGLGLVSGRVAEAERRSRHTASLRSTEEMLTRYIQQRKKKLAELALQTLVELAPYHHRREDYERWVAELDEEVAIRRRIDGELEAGREALHGGSIDEATAHLETLRQIDPDAAATLAAELAEEEHRRAEGVDIERSKARIDALLAARRLPQAEEEVDRLAGHEVPKVTVDFYRKRLADARRQLQAEALAGELEGRFERQLETGDWEGARDTAHEMGRHFKASPRSVEMFDEVERHEAEQRRRRSIEQGIATLERYVARGQRREAELALKVLHGLALDAGQLALFERKVKNLR